MARGKKYRKHAKKAAIGVAIAAPLVVAGWPTIQKLAAADVKGAAEEAKKTFSSPAGLASVGVAMIMGLVVHKIANRSGANRVIRKLTMGYLEV